MQRLIFALIFAFSIHAQAIKSRVSPLPPVDVVESPIASADQAINRMYVSGNFDVPPDLKGKVFANADLALVEVQAILDLINDRSVPNSQKSIHLIRYGLGDKRMTRALLEAARAGISVTVTTDLNPSFAGRFEGKEEFNSDVANATPLRDEDGQLLPAAEAVNTLLGSNLFRLGENFFTQPLYNANVIERVPIMHEKGLLLRSGNKKKSYFTTSNLAPNPRYNRLFEVADPLFYDHYLAHIQTLNQTFVAGKEIDDIPVQNRKLIKYKDGTSQEIAFTDGRYNPHDRYLEQLKKPFNELILSHFVNTLRAGIDGLREALTQNPKARVFSVSDDRFSSLHEWGLAAVLDGFDVWLPFGKPVYGFSQKLASQVESYVYQRPAVDPETGRIRIAIDEEGAPVDRHLLHDKTSVFLRDQESVVFTGSFNLSNNFHNAELALMMNLSPSSWVTRGIVASVKGLVQKELMVHAIPTHLATLRNAIGLITHHTDLEVPLNLAEKLYQSLVDRNLDETKTQLSRMIGIRSALNSRLPPDQIKESVDKYFSFLSWYFKTVPPPSGFGIEAQVRRATAAAVVLGIPTLPDFKKAQILKSIMWRPNLTEEQQYGFVKDALPLLGINNVDPKYLSPMKQDEPRSVGQTEQEGQEQPQKPPVPSKPAVVPPQQPPAPVGTTVSPVRPSGKVTHSIVFDWDDTIMYMPTKIKLFQKGTNKTIIITTHAYAQHRDEIGKPGTKYANYEIRTSNDPSLSSFEFFREAGTSIDDLNHFASDIRFAIETQQPEVYLGPAWGICVHELRDPEQAKVTHFLTARNHGTEEFYAGLVEWQTLLWEVYHVRIYLPPKENLHMVGETANPSAMKGMILKGLAGAYEKMGLKEVKFYDDDAGNVSAATKAFDEAKADGTTSKLKTSVIHVERPRNHIDPADDVAPPAPTRCEAAFGAAS